MINVTFLLRPTASLLDHESWENVVLAAPVIADILNQTVPDTLANYTTNYPIQDENDTVPENGYVHYCSISGNLDAG